ncbi:YqaE/Pmp3 family membrane protein [Pontibacter sp. H259]|uniref:YqaE/Pmp3 family membrane protein n=1 Tax=Pontibacter sp. H259 TaxID=3133421 RepID=UPI0030BCE2A8
MRIRNLLQLVFVLLAGQLLFACSSAKYYEFAAHKQAPYYEAKQKQAPAATKAEQTPTLSEIAIAAADEKAEAKASTPALQASVETKVVKAPVKIATVAPVAEKTNSNKLTEAEAMELVKERVATMTKAEKKELKKEFKEALKQSGSRTSIVEIILAIFIPPLAVFLHDGIGTTFWISLILTLLFWIPGVIYALLVVTDTI